MRKSFVSTSRHRGPRREYLSLELETELVRKYKEEGCEVSKERIILAHERMVGYLVKHYPPKYRDDVHQSGNEGLVYALEKFDPSVGVRFSTYAKWWVLNNIRECASREHSLVQTLGHPRREKIFIALLKSVERDRATLERIAIETEATVKEVESMAQWLQGDISTNYNWWDAPDPEMDVEAQVDEILRKERTTKLISRALRTLNERERDVIKCRRLQAENPYTLEELGQKYDVSKERIRQIEFKAMEKIEYFIRRDRQGVQLVEA